MNKQILSLLLAFLLVFTMFLSGCNKTVPSTDSKSSTSSKNSSSSKESSESEGESSEDTSSQEESEEDAEDDGESSETGYDGDAAESQKPERVRYRTELKQTDYISDKALWETPALREQGFQFSNAILPDATKKNATLLKYSIDYYELGEYASVLPSNRAWEWDYAPNQMVPGFNKDGKPNTTGWGSLVSENGYLEYLYTNYDEMLKKGNPEEVARIKNPLATRQGALDQLKIFIKNIFKIDMNKPWMSDNGHYPYQHYAGEFGASVIGSEIGETIHNYQMQIAFNRGAARQYQTPWAICFSYWHGPDATNYDVPDGGKNGHSISLFKRSILMSYMAGVDVFDTEGGGGNSFLPRLDDDGFYELSPHGVATQEFMKFQRANSDIGVNYTPVGVVLDYYHGSYARDGVSVSGRSAFSAFAYDEGDKMTWSLMNTLWPGVWTHTGNEINTMVNNTYGDYYDVLLQNAPQNILNTYPVLVLSGSVKLSATEKQRYVDYVKQGGTLLLNTAYLGQFPEYSGTLGGNGRYEKADGSGRVIVYGADYKIDKLAPVLRELISRLVPIKVTGGNIQQMVNFKDGTMYVTLINNEGVTKEFHEEEVVDFGKYKTVSVTYTGPYTVKACTDVYGGEEVYLSGETAKVTVKPGSCVVLEFRI